jgi:outer membrane protein TolC
VSAPVFNGGMLAAEKRGAEQAYQAALAQYEETVVRAFSQVADALTALSHDAEMLDTVQAGLTTASASLDLARKSHEAGSIGVLQVEAARRELAQAQLRLVEAQSQQLLDATQLFVALGD